MATTKRRVDYVHAVAGEEGEQVALLSKHLNQALANLTDLSMDYKQAHWNLLGIDFGHLHPLFDRFTDEARAWADLVAERAVMVGGIAHGTIEATTKASQLPVFPEEERDQRALLEHLAECARVTDEHLRQAIDETDDQPITQDVFVEVARGLQMQRWMLQSHLR